MLADLIARVRAAETLPLSMRQNWVWALKTVARAAGKDPAEVPAHPEFLRKVSKRAAPAAMGLGRKAWNNARSLMGKVLEWAGLASMPGHYQAPFSPAWAGLWSKLPPDTAISFQLSRLFHYASAQGVAPTAMCDAVLANFYEALVTESIVQNPYEIWRGAARSWNNAVDRIPGWPQQRLTTACRRRYFSLPWTAFPLNLEAAVEAYLRRAGGLDLGDDLFIRAQRPATLRTRRGQLRLFATALVNSGVPPETLVDLQTMLVPEVAARGLQYLVDRNNGVSGVQIANIAAFLPTLARRIEMATEVVDKLRRVAKKLNVAQSGMTERNREALRAFDDHAAVEALLAFPQQILRKIEACGYRGYREAKNIQTALAVELLINAPVRIQNLASIQVGQHLVEVGSRAVRAVHLHFRAPEVKNHNDLEFPLMSEAISLLDIYRSEWRPLLTKQASPFLFPGEEPNRHKGTGALSSQIRKLVYAYTRLEMPAHRFRHAAAKIFLDRNPGQYEVVRQLLGHKDIETTTAFYAGAERAAAMRYYAKTILGIRGSGLGAEIQHG